MIIYINEEPLSLETSYTLDNLLKEKLNIGSHVAIAINNQLVPRSLFSSTVLQTNDRIDLITPMQGG